MRCYKLFFLLSLLFSPFITAYSQSNTVSSDSIQLEAMKIMAYAIDGDVKSALKLMEVDSTKKLISRHVKFREAFEKRFKFIEDKSNYLSDRKSSVDGLLKIYIDYWRLSLLDNSKNYDSLLKNNLITFLKTNYKPARKLSYSAENSIIDKLVKSYAKSFGLYTTGYANSGKFKDLFLWRNEKDTTYKFTINSEEINVRVILMDNFISLGWEEYATMDKMHPGGWATKKALYCVKKSYDLESETFLISYLAHEGRHFSDFKIFPHLSSTDLEYRAKLTELSSANTTIFTLIEYFLATGNYNSDNDHQIANYCVMHDLSKKIFNKDSEMNITVWKEISIEKINAASYMLLQANTEQLKKLGKTVEKFIKQ